MASTADVPEWGFWRADCLMPGVVDSVVGYAAHGVGRSIHRGLPSPHLTFVISFDEPVVTGWSVEEAAGRAATRVDVVAAGLHTEPAYVWQPPAQSGIQIAVHPTAARTVFGVPAAELSHRTFDGNDVGGPEITVLRNRLIENPDWAERFALVHRFLRDRVDRAADRPAVRTEVVEAWSWLVRHRGAGRISSLAEHVLLSPRQLNAVFTGELGVGPKRFNRLLRLQQAKQAIARRVARGESVGLADIAARCGFADQAHLTRDFASLVGTSPSRWLAEEISTLSADGYREPGAPPKRSSPPGGRRGTVVP
ncbi:AraC family transcriptional regulator [Oerskovia flava]|uniref:AraC family transcriptional regulator n=1 Tax=Oerskovia flava TaxID=2986422 RepID=UPI00223F13B2|nr:helix-turn-helix domain-containing protein [Oerskovia sp. JB1-3-2]